MIGLVEMTEGPKSARSKTIACSARELRSAAANGVRTYSAAIRSGSAISAAAARSTDSSRDTPALLHRHPVKLAHPSHRQCTRVTTRNRVSVSRTIPCWPAAAADALRPGVPSSHPTMSAHLVGQKTNPVTELAHCVGGGVPAFGCRFVYLGQVFPIGAFHLGDQIAFLGPRQPRHEVRHVLARLAVVETTPAPARTRGGPQRYSSWALVGGPLPVA